MKTKIFAAALLLCLLFARAYAQADWKYAPYGNGGIVLTAYTGKEAEVTVPAEVDGLDVVALGEGLFARNQYVESVAISEGIETMLGGDTFYFCANLKRVSLPVSLTEFEEGNPFSDCMSLEEIIVAEGHPRFRVDASGVLFDDAEAKLVCYPPARNAEKYSVPAGTRIIETNAFSCAAYLVNVDLPEGLREIRNGAFASCIQLERMTLPEGVVSCGTAFESCLKLTNVDLPASLVHLEGNPFGGCARLTELSIAENNPRLAYENGVIYDKADMRLIYALPAATAGDCTLPEGLLSIAPKAFMGCNDTEEVFLPEGLVEIGTYAFYDTCITGVNLPASVSSVGNGAFASCNSLKNITVAPENPVYYDEDGVLFCRSDARLVCYPAGRRSDTYAVPDGISTIGVGAFQANGYVESVLLPEGVTQIEAAAFNNCTALSAMLFPRSLSYIGDSAFASSGLSSAVLGGGIRRMGSNVFSACAADFRLIVAEGSNAQAYAEHEKLNYVYTDALEELARGSRGGSVVLLQQKLIREGWLDDDADGVYGPLTEAAVSAFQEASGMEMTGKADSATLIALYK